MHRALLGVVVIALVCPRAWPAAAKNRPRGRKAAAKAPARKPPGGGGAKAFSDRAVAEAIRRGREFLWRKRKPNGSWEAYGHGKNRSYPAGPTSLAVYALLASGVSPADKRMQASLDWLAKQKTDMTYTLGLRCNAWYLANKETRGKYLPHLKADLVKLLRFTKSGAYHYYCRPESDSGWDNSNSQYGVLGAWAGALGNLEIPAGYWKLVLKHWLSCQQPDGGWFYRAKGASTATMTAGGIATLYVCFDNLLAARFVSCSVDADFKPLTRGLTWMDRHFRQAMGSQKLMGYGDLFYFLYGVERVGLASGYKYFGTVDWYKLGAEKLLAAQRNDGSWQGKRPAVVSTAFALLFLVRGQHAVAFNKLEFDGDWNNRPRDLAMLTRWMSDQFERTLNWQIINLKVPPEQWHDAPILYISGSKPPKFTPPQLDRLRQFVQEGGTIFSATECGGKGFSEGIREVVGKLFPGYKLVPLPPDHPLFSIHHKLTSPPPVFQISNGIRPLVLHTDRDLPRSWQVNASRSAAADFQLAANVLMYVTDRMVNLRNRGVSHWPARPRQTPARTVKVARVRHEGNWNPEPLALERFGRLLAEREKVALEVARPVSIARLAACDAKVAFLTGTGPLALPDAAAAQLKAFVEKGGTVLIDAAGGDKKFAEDAEAMLQGLYGRRAVRSIAGSAAPFNLAGHKITEVAYTRSARMRRGLKSEPNLRGVWLGQRLGVVFSREDLTGGLVGIHGAGSVGYAPESCYQIVRNVVLSASQKPARPARR